MSYTASKEGEDSKHLDIQECQWFKCQRHFQPGAEDPPALLPCEKPKLNEPWTQHSLFGELGTGLGRRDGPGMAKQEHWPSKDVTPALSTGAASRLTAEMCGSSQQERHHSDLVPLPHPSTRRCLCALTATRYPAPRPSLGLHWKQMVCCVRPASAKAEVTSTLMGRQSSEAAVTVPSPFPGGGSASSIMLLTRACACSGVGRGRIWLLRELIHPIQNTAICFHTPNRRQQVHRGMLEAADWHKEEFQGACALLLVGKQSFLPCGAPFPPSCASEASCPSRELIPLAGIGIWGWLRAQPFRELPH